VKAAIVDARHAARTMTLPPFSSVKVPDRANRSGRSCPSAKSQGDIEAQTATLRIMERQMKLEGRRPDARGPPTKIRMRQASDATAVDISRNRAKPAGMPRTRPPIDLRPDGDFDCAAFGLGCRNPVPRRRYLIHGQRFCCEACRVRRWHKRLHERWDCQYKPCAWCGQEMSPTSQRSVVTYCSAACRQAAYRARRKRAKVIAASPAATVP
jgi:hypothetical protein